VGGASTAAIRLLVAAYLQLGTTQRIYFSAETGWSVVFLDQVKGLHPHT